MKTRVNAYEFLGLSENCDALQLASAFRQKVFEAHPDRGGAAEFFLEVKRAHDILKTPHLRETLALLNIFEARRVEGPSSETGPRVNLYA